MGMGIEDYAARLKEIEEKATFDQRQRQVEQRGRQQQMHQ